MSQASEAPAFNLKVVIQETGLKPDTLRVWERRYGLPSPERTAGGHRLYSERDIATIRWLLERKDEGLSISRAVALWERMVKQGQDPLEPEPPAVEPARLGKTASIQGQTMNDMRDQWIAACLSFDEQRAELVLAQAFAQAPPEVVSIEVLQKGIAEIGAGWYEGKITVQQEHFGSTLAMRRLDALVMAAPPPTRPGRVLVACPPDEDHTFGSLLLTFLLRRRGLDVIFLGANVPAEKLETMLESTRPRLVILSAQQLHTAGTLLDMARALQQAQVPLAYGGSIFNLLPAARAQIPGHFLGEQIEEAIQVVESLLALPQRRAQYLEQDTRPSPLHETARLHFAEQQAAIESQLWQRFQASGLPHSIIAIANANMARGILAALKLENMALIGTDIQWIQGLLSNYKLPAEQLDRYLQEYRQAAETHLDERAAPVLSWLRQVTGQRR